MTDQQLVENNFEEKINVFTRAVNGTFNSDEIISVANTHIPTDTFNTILIKTDKTNHLSDIRLAIEQLIKSKLPFSVWASVEHMNADWREMLQSYGLQEVERLAMMKRKNTLSTQKKTSGQLEITRVKSKEELLKYVDVFLSLFAGTPEHTALQSYFNTFHLYASVQMYIGCIDNKPVATGLLIACENSYGIYDVMIKEPFRGRGLGSDMFQFLLNQTEDKEKPIVLQASDDGKNIYRRFNFTEVGEMVVFEKD